MDTGKHLNRAIRQGNPLRIARWQLAYIKKYKIPLYDWLPSRTSIEPNYRLENNHYIKPSNMKLLKHPIVGKVENQKASLSNLKQKGLI
jgi:hypothetical protein